MRTQINLPIVWVYLWFWATLGAGATGPSGIAQVDLIFPRNETYTPTSLMPVVFSVRSPELVNLLYPTLQYAVTRVGSNDTTTKLRDLPIRRLDSNDSLSYLYEGVASVAAVEGEFELSWAFRWVNCSRSIDGSDYDNQDTAYDQNGFHRRTYWPHQKLFFRTSKDGKKADLASISQDKNCNEMQGFAFQVKDNLEVPLGRLSADGVTSCALLASPTPTTKPFCEQIIKPEAVSSISASLTKVECRSTAPVVSCPAESGCGPIQAQLGVLLAASLLSIAFTLII